MAVSLLSERWYRVAALIPRWRLNLRMDRQMLRGERWYLLSDGASGRTVRIDERAYALVGRCDGQATLDEVWDAAIAADPQNVATQDEAIAIIANTGRRRLSGMRRLDSTSMPWSNGPGASSASHGRQRLNPLALRFALVDPSRWLERAGALSALLFGRVGAAAWLLLMAWAGAIVLADPGALAGDAARTMASPRSWLIAWLCFAPVKLIHEAAHALALRRFAGNVHEAGIGLLMGLPAPYVDASQAHRITSAPARALVGAAGILAELAVAALGLVIWQAAEPGLVRQIGLTIALIGSVSTLAFNANPLTRMDGYYVLTDLLQLPNLAGRSTRYWQQRLARAWLGVAATDELTPAPGERSWLLGYAPAAWSYRAMIGAWLTVWLGAHYAPAGLACAALVTITTLLQPALRLWHRHVITSPVAGRAVAGTLALPGRDRPGGGAGRAGTPARPDHCERRGMDA